MICGKRFTRFFSSFTPVLLLSFYLSWYENISPDLSAVRQQSCRIRDDRKGRGSGREGAALPDGPGALGDARWRGSQRDGRCGREIKTNGMQRYAETRKSFLTESHSAAEVALLARQRDPSMVEVEKEKFFKLTSGAA